MLRRCLLLLLLATGGLAHAAILLLTAAGQDRAILVGQAGASSGSSERRRSVSGPDHSHVIQGLIVHQREALRVAGEQATQAAEDGLDRGVAFRILGHERRAQIGGAAAGAKRRVTAEARRTHTHTKGRARTVYVRHHTAVAHDHVHDPLAKLIGVIHRDAGLEAHCRAFEARGEERILRRVRSLASQIRCAQGSGHPHCARCMRGSKVRCARVVGEASREEGVAVYFFGKVGVRGGLYGGRSFAGREWCERGGRSKDGAVAGGGRAEAKTGLSMAAVSFARSQRTWSTHKHAPPLWPRIPTPS